MVAAISPADINYEETLSTLRHASILYYFHHTSILVTVFFPGEPRLANFPLGFFHYVVYERTFGE